MQDINVGKVEAPFNIRLKNHREDGDVFKKY